MKARFYVSQCDNARVGLVAEGNLMLGTNIILPFLAMAAGGLLGTQIYGPDGLVTGGAIGFGVGCAVVALVWVLFAVLKKWVE